MAAATWSSPVENPCWSTVLVCIRSVRQSAMLQNCNPLTAEILQHGKNLRISRAQSEFFFNTSFSHELATCLAQCATCGESADNLLVVIGCNFENELLLHRNSRAGPVLSRRERADKPLRLQSLELDACAHIHTLISAHSKFDLISFLRWLARSLSLSV